MSFKLLDVNTTDLITCLICYRDFDTGERKPVVLQCGHTFCLECRNLLMRETIDVRCGICRAVSDNGDGPITNWQFIGHLGEKEKLEKKQETSNEKDDHLQLRIARSSKLQIHVAAKPDSTGGPELFVRKNAEGDTQLVIASKTGGPKELVDFVNKEKIRIESGVLKPTVVGATKRADRFAKVSKCAKGQSALQTTETKTPLESLVYTDSFELKASDDNGSLKLELVRNGEVPKCPVKVLGGTTGRVGAKRLRQLHNEGQASASSSTPSTSSKVDAKPPPAKRGRRPKRGVN